MNAFFNRWLPAGTLALWGGVILYYWAIGRLQTLLEGEFQVYAIIAAPLLIIGAVVLAFSKLDASCCAGAACSHALGRNKTGRLLTFAIILLPIGLQPLASKAALEAVRAKNATAISDTSSLSQKQKDEMQRRLANRPADPATSGDNLITPGKVSTPPPLPLPAKEGEQPPAGGTAQTPSGSQPPAPADSQKHPAAAEQQSFSEYLQRTPEGHIIAEVLDLLYAAQDPVLRNDFEAKKIQLIVQYMPDSSASASSARFKGVRMFMTCCAADARPIATLIESDKLPDVPEMTWVKVVGTATFPIERGRRVSVVKAEKIEKTEPPPENMLN